MSLRLAVVVCALAVLPLQAARDFTKNTGNYLSLGANALGPRFNGVAFVSISAWVQIDSVSGSGSDNRVINIIMDGTTTTGMQLGFFNNAGTAQVRVGGRSTTTDSFQQFTSGNITDANWHQVGGTLDFAGDAIKTVLDGTVASGGVTFTNGTYTQAIATDGDSIGGERTPPTTTDRQFDGRIAEVAVWVANLSNDDWNALAKRRSPRMVKTGALRFYAPLLGEQSPERDAFGLLGTITGSLPKAEHPPIIR